MRVHRSDIAVKRQVVGAEGDGLLRRGYSEADVRKILGGNVLRVLDAVPAWGAMRV